MSFEYCHLVGFRNACQCSRGQIVSQNASGKVNDLMHEKAAEIGVFALVARQLLPCF